MSPKIFFRSTLARELFSRPFSPPVLFPLVLLLARSSFPSLSLSLSNACPSPKQNKDAINFDAPRPDVLLVDVDDEVAVVLEHRLALAAGGHELLPAVEDRPGAEEGLGGNHFWGGKEVFFPPGEREREKGWRNRKRKRAVFSCFEGVKRVVGRRGRVREKVALRTTWGASGFFSSRNRALFFSSPRRQNPRSITQTYDVDGDNPLKRG